MIARVLAGLDTTFQRCPLSFRYAASEPSTCVNQRRCQAKSWGRSDGHRRKTAAFSRRFCTTGQRSARTGSWPTSPRRPVGKRPSLRACGIGPSERDKARPSPLRNALFEFFVLNAVESPNQRPGTPNACVSVPLVHVIFRGFWGKPRLKIKKMRITN